MNRVLKVAVLLGVFGGICYGWLKIRPSKITTTTPPATSVAAALPAVPPPASTPPVQEAAITPQSVQPAPEPENLVRTWTSQDGRSIKAEFISATAANVTVRRDDGRTFTIPLANLSATDADWVRSRHAQNIVSTPAATATTAAPEVSHIQPIPDSPSAKSKPQEITQSRIDRVVNDFPAPAKLNGREVTNDLQQLHAKYLSMVKFIRPGTIETNLKMIRSKIVDDVTRLNPIAGTSAGDWTGKRGSSQSAAAENTILSARSALTWLQGPLTQHLAAYDALLNPQAR